MDTKRIYNLDAEKELLGSIISNNSTLYEVIELLESTDFYDEKHIKLYTAIRKLFAKDKPINLTTLAEFIGKKLPEVGGITYLTELVSSVATTQHANAYAEIIKEKSNMRTLQTSLKNMLHEAEDGELSSCEISEKLQDDMLKIKDSTEVDDGSLEKPVENCLNKLQERFKNGVDIQGIKTQFPSLDYTLNGLHSSELMIIAARPAMGKSVLANNLATNIALKSNKKVSLFNLEMSKEQLLDRMISSVGRINMDHIKTGRLADNEWEKIATASVSLMGGNLRLYDSILTLNGIKAECKKRKLKEGLDVVIIDYMQLIATRGKFQSREQEVSHVSRELKLLSKDLHCTVIALSQLSRAPEQRADHRPMLSDLRESGSLEQDADIVSFLYRDEYYNKESEDKNIIEIIIAKQRNGSIGTLKMAWLSHFQTIGEIKMHYAGHYDPKIFKEG